MPRRSLVPRVVARYRNRVQECRLGALCAKQGDLAKLTGIPRSTINALECNRLFLSSPYALLISEALNCTLDDLYERRIEPARRPGRRPGLSGEGGHPQPRFARGERSSS